MQNSRFFCRSVISRLEKSFFKKYFNPLPDTKIDHYSNNTEDYWADNQIIFLKYMSDNRDRRPKVLVSDKGWEMYADAPESKKLSNYWAEMVFMFVPPK